MAPDAGCYIRAERTIGWGSAPGEFDFTAEEAARAVEGQYDFHGTYLSGRGRLADYIGDAGPWKVGFEVDLEGEPLYRRTDGGGLNCAGPPYPDNGRAYVLPVVWDVRSADDSWRVRGPGKVLVHDINPPRLGVQSYRRDDPLRSQYRLLANPPDFGDEAAEFGPTEDWVARYYIGEFEQHSLVFEADGHGVVWGVGLELAAE